jgi:hypothetical protein
MGMSLLSRLPAYSTYLPLPIDPSIPENSVRFTGFEAENYQTTSIRRDDGKPQRAKHELKRVGRQEG